MSGKATKYFEIIAIALLIVFAVVSYLLSNFIFKKEKNNIAIYRNDERISVVDGNKIDIDVDGTYVIGDKNGEYNIIEIKNKNVRCIEANCPDEICVKHGILRKDIDNDMIICAPHRLTIIYE